MKKKSDDCLVFSSITVSLFESGRMQITQSGRHKTLAVLLGLLHSAEAILRLDLLRDYGASLQLKQERAEAEKAEAQP